MQKTNFETGDIVTCIVEKIAGTVVFVKIPVGNQEINGSITINEIAPGRIRNLRAYVVPKKRIVCKVLRVSQKGNIELSLRRVTQKEKKEALEKDKQEKSYASILKSVLADKAQEVMEKIKQEESLYDFFEEVKTNPKKIEKVLEKNNAKKVLDILNNQKKKSSIVKKEINFTTTKPNGIEIIKKTLGNEKGIEVRYLSAGKYSLKTEAENPKQADDKLSKAITRIQKSN